MNEEHLIADIAMLAGKIMLMSGADIYRVENTMQHILGQSKGEATAFVLATGISLTIRCEEETITLTRRVGERATNLNRIYEVNSVSRELAAGCLSIQEAKERLEKIARIIQYPIWLKNISYIGAIFSFSILLEGSPITCISAIIVGIGLALMHIWIDKIGFNAFCNTAIYSFGITAMAIILKAFVLTEMNFDNVIISSIMPMVPGVIFTTAIRDTFNGDYTASVARILEAIVMALAVATGTGAGMALLGGIL